MDAKWVLVWREGGGDAGRGLDASPGAAADVDVCTMAAKPVMYLSFYTATFFPDGRRRAKPTLLRTCAAKQLRTENQPTPDLPQTMPDNVNVGLGEFIYSVSLLCVHTKSQYLAFLYRVQEESSSV